MSRPSQNPTDTDETTPGSGNIRLALIALLCLGVALWISYPWESSVEVDDEEPTQTSYSATSEGLTGRVVDTTGRPIRDAVVEADGELEETDGDGTFSFEELGEGIHELKAHADGHVRPGLNGSLSVEIAAGRSPGEVELVLPQAATIAGRVVAGGEPVEDAHISLSYLHAEGIDGKPLDPYVEADIADTDDDGRFTVDAVSPGRLAILVEAGDIYAESDELYLRPGANVDDIYVDLEPSGVLRGEVVDDTGQALDAEIALESSYADSPSHRVTARNGYFSIEALHEGYYTLEATAEGYLVRTIEDLYIGADDATEIELALQQSEGVVGRVLEPDGTPVADAQVTLRSADGETEKFDHTDDNGRFQWRHITSGDWSVVASSVTHDPSERTPIEPGTEIALELAPGGNLVGRILDNRRRPVTDFTITAHALEIRGDDHRHLRSLPEIEVHDTRGRFDIGPIRSGRYRFVVESPDHPPTTTDDVEIVSGETHGPLTIQLGDEATIRGTVADLHTGAPIVGAIVTDLSSAEDEGAVTDHLGSFELNGLPNSVRTLRVEHDDYHTDILHGVDPDSDSPAYHFELTAASEDRRTISGRIGLILSPGDRGPEIIAIQPDTPAAVSILEKGDTITAVDGIPADEMTLDETLQRIRGHDHSPVVLDIHRSGLGNRTITVERERTFTN